jgi:hypothetical protein
MPTGLSIGPHRIVAITSQKIQPKERLATDWEGSEKRLNSIYSGGFADKQSDVRCGTRRKWRPISPYILQCSGDSLLILTGHLELVDKTRA